MLANAMEQVEVLKGEHLITQGAWHVHIAIMLYSNSVSFRSLLTNTVLYVLYCTVLHCTVLYCTVLYCTALFCAVLHCAVLYCAV
jgi:hypothetical protein